MKEGKKKLQRQRLDQYIQKLSKETQIYDDQITKLEQEYQEKANHQIKERFVKVRQDFKRLKKSTDQQLLTLRFYSDHPQQKGNLFALFAQIDQKLYHNSNIINSTNFKIQLPYPSNSTIEQDVNYNKIMVYQNYISKLANILKSENIRKYCKKEVESFDKIVSIYEKLLDNVKETLYCTKIKIKKSLEEGVSELARCRHAQDVTLLLTTEKGIMNTQQYHQIINSLQPNKFFLARLDLKIMDMQFSQQKCDILRKRLGNEFCNLKQTNIQNYYKQCKLGMFQDFNWHPYRKKVNINSAVW